MNDTPPPKDPIEAQLANTENNAGDISGDLYATICNTVSDAIIITRAKDNVITFVNQMFTQLTGWEKKDVVGHTFIDLNMWLNLADRGRMLKIFTEEGRVRNHLINLRHKNGQTGIALASLCPITIHGEAHILINARDITPLLNPRNESQQQSLAMLDRIQEIAGLTQSGSEIKESQTELVSLLDNTPILLVLLDQNLRIIATNNTLTQHSGLSCEALKGLACGDALQCIHRLDHPDGCGHGPYSQSCPVYNTVMDTVNTGRSHINKEFCLPTGMHPNEQRHYLLSSSFVNAAEPKIMLSFLDITQQKLAEKEKQQVQKRLDQLQRIESIGALAAGIAHDFNNILFPINGYAEMLINDLPKDEKLRENAQGIFEAGLRAKDLIKQILTITQNESQDLKSVLPHLIVKEALKLIRSTLPKHIEIRQHIDPGCKHLMGDPTQIHQLVMNLATNAYHAMEETGGTLTITLRNVDLAIERSEFLHLKPGPHIQLSVADTGTGMDQDTLKHIYDPYFTTKSQEKGTGLGLAVVHGIVMRHNGEIKVESDVGKGTTFNIFFPVAEEMDPVMEPAEPLFASEIKNKRVLFVDDDKAVIKVGRIMLQRLGYEVETYGSSTSALEAFKYAPDTVDLVLADLSMPKLSGDQLADEIRKIRPDVPVVLCTGYGAKLDLDRSGAKSISGVLKKPITKTELETVVQNALQMHHKTIN